MPCRIHIAICWLSDSRSQVSSGKNHENTPLHEIPLMHFLKFWWDFHGFLLISILGWFFKLGCMGSELPTSHATNKGSDSPIISNQPFLPVDPTNSINNVQSWMNLKDFTATSLEMMVSAMVTYPKMAVFRRQDTPVISIGFSLWLVLPSIFVAKSPITPDSPYFRWTLNPDGRQELSMSLAEIKRRPASTQAILSRWGLRQPAGRICPRLGRTTFSKPYTEVIKYIIFGWFGGSPMT